MSQDSYRAWSKSQEHLPLFWQPKWLDIISTDWTSDSTESNGKIRAIWPFLPVRKAGVQIASWPPCTPYLGPVFTTERIRPIKIPSQLSYINCTFSNPGFAWVFGRKARAMATQKISLPAKPYKPDLKRRLRNAEGKFRFGELRADVIPDTLSFIRKNWTAPIPPEAERIFQEAVIGGLGSVLALYDKNDAKSQALAYLGVVWDKKTTYLLFITKSPIAPSASTPVLLAEAIELAAQRNCSAFDFCAGYLMGVRDFFSQFGAKPQWYGQLRLANGPLMRCVEFILSRWSTSRI